MCYNPTILLKDHNSSNMSITTNNTKTSSVLDTSPESIVSQINQTNNQSNDNSNKHISNSSDNVGHSKQQSDTVDHNNNNNSSDSNSNSSGGNDTPLTEGRRLDNNIDNNINDKNSSNSSSNINSLNNRKRRRLVELRNDELWHCGYYPCKKVYSIKSTASIQQHKKTCPIALTHIQMQNIVSNNNSSSVVQQQNNNVNANKQQQWFNIQQQLIQYQQQQQQQPQYNTQSPQQATTIYPTQPAYNYNLPQIQQQIAIASSQHVPLQMMYHNNQLIDPWNPSNQVQHANNVNVNNNNTNNPSNPLPQAPAVTERMYNAIVAPMMTNNNTHNDSSNSQQQQQLQPNSLYQNLINGNHMTHFNANINIAQLTHDTLNSSKYGSIVEDTNKYKLNNNINSTSSSNMAPHLYAKIQQEQLNQLKLQQQQEQQNNVS